MSKKVRNTGYWAGDVLGNGGYHLQKVVHLLTRSFELQFYDKKGVCFLCKIFVNLSVLLFFNIFDN